MLYGITRIGKDGIDGFTELVGCAGLSRISDGDFGRMEKGW